MESSGESVRRVSCRKKASDCEAWDEPGTYGEEELKMCRGKNGSVVKYKILKGD